MQKIIKLQAECFQLNRINPSGGVNGSHSIRNRPTRFQLNRINPSGGVACYELAPFLSHYCFQLNRINPSGGPKKTAALGCSCCLFPTKPH